MTSAQQPRFWLRNSVIRNPDGKIKFKRVSAGGYEHYHIGVWLESSDTAALQRVSRVEYELHPTFANRIRESRNCANNFSITFWSWGTFVIKAKVYLIDQEEPLLLEHQLEYDLPAEDSAYIDVSD